MQPVISTLEAMLYCPYKAWRLAKEIIPDAIGVLESQWNPIAVSAWQLCQPVSTAKPSARQYKQAEKLLADTQAILQKNEPPAFFKVPHCSECQFKNDCHQKLKERDCLSLLPAMSSKSLLKYHNKGITTITQLSYLFKPRRRRAPNPQRSYLWELKALAIREQKTFVIQPPELTGTTTTIYLDFEGTRNEQHIYLLGGIIAQIGQPDESFVLWSDEEQEAASFAKLFNLLLQYPDAAIYHYGSYETKALKQATKKWPVLANQWPAIEKRMVNLLGYLRTHVYPPTYGNGLKDIGTYLNFQWNDPEADGFLSLAWRKQWEETSQYHWKEKLTRYNHDDCKALQLVHQWFCRVASDALPENTQQVAQMKKHTPYRLQHNKEFGDDFQSVTKASYFD